MLLARLKLKLYTRPRLFLKWLGTNEAKLINNIQKFPDFNNSHSVFLFSTHKCASTFLTHLLSDLAKREGKVHIDVESYLATSPQKRDELYSEKIFTEILLSKKGYYFGVFRYGFKYFNENSDSKIIMVLRDPRDILTSQYFSIAYSHPVLTEKFLKKREHALKIGIDRHVIEMSDRFLKTYMHYLDLYLGKRNVLLVKYEDMVKEFPNVLNEILNFINYSKKEEALFYWENNSPFVVQEENKHHHKRKITPGDYQEKLNKETISYLNSKFKSVLERLNYELF